MNKQQFLGELNQYLTFFSPKEREEIIASFTEKFATAGTEGESALIAELGTPMMTVIDLKRRKEAGEKFTSASINVEENADNFMEQYSVETETYESITSPEIIEEALQAEEPIKNKPTVIITEKKASPAKHTFAVIGSTVLSILITITFLAIAAVGVMLFVAMGYLLITGLQSLYYLTDALLLFAGGLICGGLGLLIIWFAVWSAISLILKLFRSAGKLKASAPKKESGV